MPLAVTSAPIERTLESRSPETVANRQGFETSLTQSMARRSTPVQRTPLSTAVASSELRRAWSRVTGDVPDDKTVALLTAQWAHETAHGASMYNYNFGGIKGVGPSGLSVEQHTKEGWGRNERQIADHFRAYENAESGAEDYVKLLTHRFPEAAKAARNGDAEGFVQGLKQRGYFTGDVHAYQRSVSSISNDLLASSFHGQSASDAERKMAPSANRTNGLSPHHESSPAHGPLATRQGDLTAMVKPLMPTVLMNALSESPTNDRDLLGSTQGMPLAYVSTSSMVDEVLRASLQMTSSENRRASDG